MGDGDNVGWDKEMGEGDKDRAEGGLSADAESSENLRAEGDRASIKFYFSTRQNTRGRDGSGRKRQQQQRASQQQRGYLCLLRGLWLQLSLLLCCSLLLSSLMILGFILDGEW